MSAGCDGPFRVRVVVPAEPSIVRVVVPAEPSLVRLVVPGPMGPGAAGGTSQQYLAGAPISGHRCVHLAGGRLQTASPDNLADADTCFGISTGGGQAGAYVAIQSSGVMEEAGWSWLPGPIFMDLDGMLTQAPPRAAFEQRVGTAVGPTRMLVAIESAIISAH